MIARFFERPARAGGSRVVVKFHDHVDVPYVDGLESRLDEFNLGAGSAVLRAFPGITFQRAFRAPNPVKLQEANIFTVFVVECPAGIDPHALAATMRNWPTVETAYVPRPVIPTAPPFDPSGNPRWVAGTQGYLQAAPQGIDAEFVWGLPNGLGENQKVADVEHGWLLNHEDLVDAKPILIGGVNKKDFFDHGAAVLGVLVASSNKTGIVGIAPAAAARAAGIFQTFLPDVADIPAALEAAIAALSAGDVLLIEEQTQDIDPVTGKKATWPVEIELLEFLAIQQAILKGIIVIEGGANSGADLAHWTDGFGARTLDPDSPGFKDSGAIIVGAATSVAPHSRFDASGTPLSNFGKRIDCYAWGENVDTCWFNGGNPAVDTHDYTVPPEFGFTSAASAIIAGAVLLLQGLAEKHVGRRFTPAEMRDLLRNPANGTPSKDPARDQIGSMPDLKKIVFNQIAKTFTPKIYLRDAPGDIGEPHSEFLSASPDIILQSHKAADPQKQWGEGSGTEASALLSEEATLGLDHFVYVRMRNKGTAPAANVLASVFFSPAATLVTPTLWIPVGTVLLPKVPIGDALTVSNPILWPAAAIPAAGHYCFVALIGNAELPAPKPEAFLVWDDFLSFIRNDVQVTWRNFNVVTPATGSTKMAFLAPGAPDADREMTLEVLSTLPREARVSLELPAALFGAAQEQIQQRPSINPSGATRIGRFRFPRHSRNELRLEIEIPEALRIHPHQIAVRQLYEGQEVGRVTWRLMPAVKRRDRYSR
ncbi:MAG TPA: S8 family serine peptidase [Thermoanaerobaculia bacterium]|nr:S8 family serine peptidase [Thermoanaerobaculia bacterium]